MAQRPNDRLLDRVQGVLAHVDPRIGQPHRPVRLGIAACVAVSVVLGLVYFVSALDSLGAEASQNAAASYDDRELGGANALGVDTEVLNEARGWIPENGRYRLLVGPSASDSDFRNYARYFLMPRRPDPDARWVLCFECDLSGIGAELDVVWQNDAGIALGRLRG